MSEDLQPPATAENAYAPPAAEHPATEDAPLAVLESRLQRRRVKRRMLWGLGVLVLGLAGTALTNAKLFMQVGWLGAIGLFLSALAGSIAGIARALRARSTDSLFPFFLTALGSVFMLVFIVGPTFVRGRQVRRFRRVVLPDVEPQGNWTTVPVTIAVPPELRETLARQWRENGRTEHASVAAFARLTQDLMELGAPPALLAAANRDARDEIRHTELCFSVASALDGKKESPGRFPSVGRRWSLLRLRRVALARLAIESLVDGALYEGVSARVIIELTRRCTEPAIAAVLRELAADEGRHAAHAWQVVEWCVAEGGDVVRYALDGAARALPADIRSDLPAAARDGAWEPYGIHGAAIETREHALARAHLMARVGRLMAEGRPQAMVEAA